MDQTVFSLEFLAPPPLLSSSSGATEEPMPTSSCGENFSSGSTLQDLAFPSTMNFLECYEQPVDSLDCDTDDMLSPLMVSFTTPPFDGILPTKAQSNGLAKPQSVFEQYKVRNDPIQAIQDLPNNILQFLNPPSGRSTAMVPASELSTFQESNPCNSSMSSENAGCADETDSGIWEPDSAEIQDEDDDADDADDDDWSVLRDSDIPSRAAHRHGPGKLTCEFLEAQGYFDMEMKVAAQQLGMGATKLKKLCRDLGLSRWPYRHRCSMKKLADQVREDAHMPNEEKPSFLADIQACMQMQGPTKKVLHLRQVLFKRKHDLKKHGSPSKPNARRRSVPQRHHA
jgi:hypothetical protein